MKNNKTIYVLSALFLMSLGGNTLCQAQNNNDDDYFLWGIDKGEEWIDAIRIIEPACRSNIKGVVNVKFIAPGMFHAEAYCWGVPDQANPSHWGHDVNLTPKGIKLGKDGSGSFKFDAEKFPAGPMTVRICASDGKGQKDEFELQLYNKGGVKWKQGIPLNNPPGAKGLKLVFADDFDGAMSISNDGRNARYCAHKPRFGDFGSWAFADVDGEDNPFEQYDGYLRIKARKQEGKKGSTGLIASVNMDGEGFWAKVPFYMECRFIAQSAPGTWPAFWTVNQLDWGVPGGDELDIIEAYGGRGKGRPNHEGYSVFSHYWGQVDENGKGKNGDRTRVPITGLGGKSYWSTTFHTYAVYAGYKETIYYFDNIEVFRHPTTDDTRNNPHIFLANLAIGGNPFPVDLERYGNGSDMYIDYIRVYAEKELKDFSSPPPATKAHK